MSTLKNDKDQYKKYLSGKMKPDEAHAFERKVLNDPFEQEALEGLERIDSQEAINDIEKLQKAVLKKENSRPVWMKVAAVVALLIISSLTVWMITSPLSEQELALGKQDNISADSIGTEKSDASIENKPFEKARVADETPEVPTKQDEKNQASPLAKLKVEPLKEDEKIEEEVKEEEKPVDVQVADLKKIELADDAFQIASETQVEKEIASDDIVSIDDSETVTNTLQGKIAGVKIRGNKIIQKDSTNDPDLTSKLIARESAGRSSKDRAKKSAPVSGAFSRSASVSPSRTITGKVSDESGEGLPGVNVVVKGTTRGTTTDIDGNYSLEVDENASLVISYVGFEAKEIETAGRNTVDISLGSGATQLSEVIVTGYGESDENTSYSAAKPIDGNKSYKKYLEENLIYPNEARANEVEGTVILQLTISSGGQISDITVKKSLGYGCDQEAIRLVREGPKWLSAERDGAGVEDKVRVKVRFKK